MNWLTENYDTILQILGGIYVIATLIATLTPTGKDDTILAKIGNFFDRIGIQLKKPRIMIALIMLVPVLMLQPGCSTIDNMSEDNKAVAKRMLTGALKIGLQFAVSEVTEKNPDLRPIFTGLSDVLQISVNADASAPEDLRTTIDEYLAAKVDDPFTRQLISQALASSLEIYAEFYRANLDKDVDHELKLMVVAMSNALDMGALGFGDSTPDSDPYVLRLPE